MIEIIQVGPSVVESLANFFQELKETGDDLYFHPHEFSAEEAKYLSEYKGPDLYCVLIESERVLAYGMLRGYEAGYDVPSLGIVVHPSERGKGLGKSMMNFLHTVARRKGSKQVRLKVYPSNIIALSMYKSLGYIFGPEEDDQLVGLLDLV